MLALQDLRASLRSLRRTPAVTIVVVATVAVGIAASATVFSLVDALFWKPLPGVAAQSRLVNVHATAPDGSTFHSVSYPTWRDLGDGGGAFSGLAAFSSRLASLSDGGEPKLAIVQIVTGNYFTVLGARPALGRFFGPAEDEEPGRDAVAVLGHRAWTTRFAADPSIVGRTIALNGHPFTVVGVAEPGFVGTFLAFPFDVWVPSMMAPTLSLEDAIASRERAWLELVGRLAPGVTLEGARQRMAVLSRRLEKEHPDSQRGVAYDLRPTTGFEDSLREPAVGFFAVLACLAALLLTVACVNVTSLLLARGLAREKEVGIRLAIGAGRGRLLRLFVLETLVLFGLGGAAGAFLATLTTPLLERFRLPTPVPLVFDLSPGPRVIGFSILAACAAGVVFGLIAAIPVTRASSLAALGARDSTERPSLARLRSLFVALQVGASVLLLVTAGLFLRTVRRAGTLDPGFEPEGVSLTRIDLAMLGYDGAHARAFYDRLRERVATLPGVEAATVAGVAPLGLSHRTTAVSLPGLSTPADQVSVDFTDVGEAYFSTMRVPIVRGRAFRSEDAPGAPLAAIVNETLSRKMWPGRDPVGQTMIQDGKTLTVVGVARDGKYRNPWEAPRPYLYVAFRQQDGVREEFLVRSDRTPAALAAALAAEIHRIEPALPVTGVISLREHIGFSTLPQRVAATIAGGLGAIGVALSAIGLAGLVAYSVTRRTRELGIRMALGAAPAHIVQLVMHGGIRVAAAGLAIGTAAALIAARVIQSLLFRVEALDLPTFGAAFLLLAIITLAASWLPARRAARISPMRALRND